MTYEEITKEATEFLKFLNKKNYIELYDFENIDVITELKKNTS